MAWKKLVLILALVGVALAFTTAAQAECQEWGHIVYQYHSSNGFTYYYLGTCSGSYLPDYYTYYYTNNAKLIFILNAAMAENTWISITGEAAVCPDEGIIRPGGRISSVEIMPLG